MNASLLKGTVAAGLALFVWYAIANELPGHQSPILSLKDDAALAAALQAQQAQPGTYFLNHVPGQLAVGPGYWGWATLHRSESYAFLPSIIGSLVTQLIVAFCLGWLLQRAGPRSFGGRWALVMVAAVAATLAGPLTYWNWSWFSAGYAATQVFDLLVGWALAGAILAKLIAPIPSA